MSSFKILKFFQHIFDSCEFCFSLKITVKLNSIFLKYAPAEFDYNFNKTQLLVRIQVAECISRSEAKRMTHRLGEFQQVDLDFQGVKTLGQGFADEVFRVFLRGNPGMKILLHNLKPSLQTMVKHVLDSETAKRVSFP